MTGDVSGTAAAAPVGTLRRWVEHPRVQAAITALILLNAVTLGLETWDVAMAAAGPVLVTLDKVIISIFVIEIIAKLIAYRGGFFRNGWNLFDFIVVGIALVPATQTFSVLRALRVLRVLRLISIVPQMRMVVQALFAAIPGMGAIVALLGVVYYVCAVIATRLFGDAFPDWFGSIGESTYSLFQIMTLESWSMGIVRPVMETYPFAWAFFVPFILITSFAVLNLFIALIVNSMQAIHDAEEKRLMAEAKRAAAEAADDRGRLAAKLEAIEAELSALRHNLERE